MYRELDADVKGSFYGGRSSTAQGAFGLARKHVNDAGTDKRDLPSKVCVVCGLPFSWRRKWAKDWPQVKYCSERCRRAG